MTSKVSKAQRRAQQAEFNRQLWAEAYVLSLFYLFIYTSSHGLFIVDFAQSASNPIAHRESPQAFHFLEAQNNVPLKQDLKPSVTVLSRKPQPSRSAAAVNPPTAGMARLAVTTDDTVDDTEEEEERKNKAPEPTPEERQAMALRNLEERQRKYEEVRERLFGSPSADASGSSSPRSATPPNRQSDGRGKGKSRGGGRENNYKDKRDPSSASSKSRQLYDPGNYSGRSNVNYVQRKESQSPNERAEGSQHVSPRQPLRNPRGPDPSGRGGFKAGSQRFENDLKRGA